MSALLKDSHFDDALDYLIPIKLKLKDINALTSNANSALKFRRGLDVNSDKQEYINSHLKKYFPKSYFNVETNLDDLYEEYALNEEYKKLVDTNQLKGQDEEG